MESNIDAFIAVSSLMLVLCIVGYIVAFLRKEPVEWFSKKCTTTIKGISILTVLWAHICFAIGINGVQFIAATGVSLFLFLSGYGISKSVEKNGLKFFWCKRIVKVIIPIWILELIWELTTCSFSIENYLKACLSLRAGGWFVVYILECYLVFYFTEILVHFGQKRLSLNTRRVKLVCLFLFFGAFFFIESIFPTYQQSTILRSRQMLSFPLGVTLALYFGEIDKVRRKFAQEKSSIIKLLCCMLFFVIGATFMVISRIPSIINGNVIIYSMCSLPTVIMFAVGILCFMGFYPRIMNNTILHFLGVISYEIYIVQNLYSKFFVNSVMGVVVYSIAVILGAAIFWGLLSIVKKKK